MSSASTITPKSITPKSLYDYFVIEEWENEEKDPDTDGFSYIQNYDKHEHLEKLHDKMFNEFNINYENFNAKRSCLWVDEVKRRAKWVRGETLYGFSREKHYTYNLSWSRDLKAIGLAWWILEADGYLSINFTNGYTLEETKDTKKNNKIRVQCLYNDKNCDELYSLKK